MADVSAIKQIFSVQSAAWTGVALLFLLIVRVWNGAPAMFEQWVALRRARAEEKAADWTRLREENKRLDDRCIRLESAEERCRTELSAVKERLSTLEATWPGKARLRRKRQASSPSSG